jgi:transcriptional regulator with XRE-family HTH domain
MLKDYITITEVNMNIISAEEIKSLRKEMGYKSAKELSKLLGFGDATISRWECGMSTISKSHGLMVEGFLKVPSFREFILRKNGIDMFENGEWIEEGVIQVSEDEMKDVLKYIYGGIK